MGRFTGLSRTWWCFQSRSFVFAILAGSPDRLVLSQTSMERKSLFVGRIALLSIHLAKRNCSPFNCRPCRSCRQSCHIIIYDENEHSIYPPATYFSPIALLRCVFRTCTPGWWILQRVWKENEYMASNCFRIARTFSLSHCNHSLLFFIARPRAPVSLTRSPAFLSLFFLFHSLI